MNFRLTEYVVGDEPIYYCPKHKEYFSNYCSNCMVDENEPDIKATERNRLYSWGNEPCPHHSKFNPSTYKRECPICWQSLKEEGIQ